jgi:superfamily II DNA or RNA helicase
MHLFIQTHNYSLVQDPTPQLRKLLSYENKIYNKYKKQWKTQKYSLLENDNIFLTGLVSYIREHLPVEVTDNRSFPPVQFLIPTLTETLRPYQVDYCLKALKLNRCIIESSTGSGKTLMMAAIMSILNIPTLIIASDNTMETQLQTELMRLLVKPPKFAIGIARNLINMGDVELQQYPLLLVDEAHKCAASQATEVIIRNNAPFRFGFTGTATGRSDGKDLVVQGLLGEIIKLVETDTLVEQGYLAKTHTTFYYGNWEGEYNVLEDLLIVNNPKRNELIVKIVQMYKKETILILVRRIDHGEILQKLIKNSVFIHGDTPVDVRENMRIGLNKGTQRVLIASNIFSTGLDIPSLEIGINAAGGKSDIVTTQKLGRVMRPWNDICKKWIDIYDSWHPTLEGHSKERFRSYKKAGVSIELVGFPFGKQRSLEDEVY